MLGGDVGLAGEVELTHAPALAPLAQMIADRAHRPCHDSDDSAERRGRPINSGGSGFFPATETTPGGASAIVAAEGGRRGGAQTIGGTREKSPPPDRSLHAPWGRDPTGA